MVKTPCYIARYPGDERVEQQRKEVRRRFIITANARKRSVPTSQDNPTKE